MLVENTMLQEAIGGIITVAIAIYGVKKKLEVDKVELTNQRSEINIIETLMKQRDDALLEVTEAKEKIESQQHDYFEFKEKIIELEYTIKKLNDELDSKNTEIETLRDIIQTLHDTIEEIKRYVQEESQP